MSEILLTGGGFLGSAIRAAFEQRPDVSLFEIVRPGASRPGRIFEADLASAEDLRSVLRRVRPSAVVHAAGRVTGTPDDLRRDNVVTSIALAEAILAESPDSVFIVLGSAAEYGLRSSPAPITETDACAPAGAYGQAKLECFLALDRMRAAGLRCNYLRVFNPIGPGVRHQVVGAFLQQAANLLPKSAPRVVRMGNLDSVRDFIPTRDVASFVVGLSTLGEWGHTLNVCSGQGYVVRDIIDRLARLAASPLDVESHGPAPEFLYSIGDVRRSAAIARRFRGSEYQTPIDDALKDAWTDMLVTQSLSGTMDAARASTTGRIA